MYALPGPFQVTNRSVLAIAVPMTFAYLSTPLLGLVDTAVIGQLGSAVLLGGIAVGAIVFDVLFTTFNFLRSGTTGLTAQALGAGNHDEQKAALYRALIIAVLAGLAVIVLQAPILSASLWLMGAPVDVNAATADYFEVRVLSAPFALANYAILGWFLGLGRAVTGLLLQVLLNGINMVLSATFVLAFGWGIKGVAWSTVIGEAFTCLVGMVLVLRTLGHDSRLPIGMVLERTGMIRTLGLNRDIMIRSFSLLMAFALFTSGGARQGEIVLAANAVPDELLHDRRLFPRRLRDRRRTVCWPRHRGALPARLRARGVPDHRLGAGACRQPVAGPDRRGPLAHRLANRQRGRAELWRANSCSGRR